MPRLPLLAGFLLSSLVLFSCASPYGSLSFADHSLSLQRRTDPYFPNDPPSCPKCAKDWPNINSCAAACPVLANFTMVIFNPGAFIDVIKCACADTFQSAFPQCVDCFIQTNQTEVLNKADLPPIVDGMRKVCAMSSTLLGNVSVANNPTSTAHSKPTSAAMGIHPVGGLASTLAGILLSAVVL